MKVLRAVMLAVGLQVAAAESHQSWWDRLVGDAAPPGSNGAATASAAAQQNNKAVGASPAPSPLPPDPFAPKPSPPPAPVFPSPPPPAPPIFTPSTGVAATPLSQKGPDALANQLSQFSYCRSTSSKTERRLSLDVVGTLTSINPVKSVEEILTSIAVVVVLFFVWKHRREVLVILTGDPIIHANFMDFVWWFFFRCCGLCSHEWSRWLFCGTNIVKKFGADLGVANTTVEICNIVVGDLPVYSHGSFFLTVEANANPAMTTSLQEDKDPKTVHFPEILTLRIRDSHLEDNVVITVKQLKFVGAEDICQVQLRPSNVVYWATRGTREQKRFAMKPMVDDTIEVETSPWVSVEFGTPVHDMRHIDHFHGNATGTIRITTDTEVGKYEDRSIKDFKHDYVLVDNTGNAVEEPDEGDLTELACYSRIALLIYQLLTTVVTLSVIAYGAFRYYVRNCYTKFEELTIASRWTPELTFPIPSCVMRSLGEECAEKMEGTGIAEGGNVCRPSHKDVQRLCTNPPQKRPRAFQYIVQDLGLADYTDGVQCFEGLCEIRGHLVDYDKSIAILAIFMVIWTFCVCRPCLNYVIGLRRSCIMDRRNSSKKSRSRGLFG
eukprot:TRINITY_DN38768_c0_g1_i1.p1 TRINITY_DN38768_c0_g1~~TRINITY_DN38768_c0_g1_i1.p1  ORF type:complete len:607 (-),score=83.12 TRINITY_DN38768_c0_g1_i1:180-2000(-)